MTQELASKLIAHYLKVIEKVKQSKSKKERNVILQETNTQAGICGCAKFEFFEDVEEDKWIASNLEKGSFYWASCPIFETKKEALRLLKLRVKILKTFKP